MATCEAALPGPIAIARQDSGAAGGTLFLDEVGEMSLRMQAILLRFLESGEIQTVGDQGPRHVDVRLIAATNRNLAERVAAVSFEKT